MPDAGPQRERSTAGPAAARRDDAARRADHAAIAKLTEDLLPALMAKLGSTNLGELEVREGDWTVRLRRPFGTGPGEGRRATDRPSRSQPGHEGHSHGRAAPEGRSRSGGGGSGAGSSGGASGVTAGTGAASAATNGTGAARGGGAGARSGSGSDGADRSRAIATSPAVGIFEPGAKAASGTKVRAGDSLGSVNVIGVPQDVLAPADGIVGSTLVEGGTAVEYGQELIRIELATTSTAEAR